MAGEQPTCDVCGAQITEDRGGDLVTKPGASEPVWVHPTCYYVPRGDARFALLSLNDPIGVDSQGWVGIRDVEAQRGRFSGSDSADFEAGLDELVKAGWVEAREDGNAFRITGRGSMLRRRVTLN